jgi:hypothetical protein
MMMHLDTDEFERQLMVSNFVKELRERGLPEGEKGKPMCLELGECSPPSGQMGYPHEAIQIAKSHTKDENSTNYP